MPASSAAALAAPLLLMELLAARASAARRRSPPLAAARSRAHPHHRSGSQLPRSRPLSPRLPPLLSAAVEPRLNCSLAAPPCRALPRSGFPLLLAPGLCYDASPGRPHGSPPPRRACSGRPCPPSRAVAAPALPTAAAAQPHRASPTPTAAGSDQLLPR
nr:wiskott-Aldrich syndrome protein homolog 1-like [Aegilops tauschii subsp. strangulata]